MSDVDAIQSKSVNEDSQSFRSAQRRPSLLIKNLLRHFAKQAFKHCEIGMLVRKGHNWRTASRIFAKQTTHRPQ